MLWILIAIVSGAVLYFAANNEESNAMQTVAQVAVFVMLLAILFFFMSI